jgi:PAS domain S-box-containing protein
MRASGPGWSALILIALAASAQAGTALPSGADASDSSGWSLAALLLLLWASLMVRRTALMRQLSRVTGDFGPSALAADGPARADPTATISAGLSRYRAALALAGADLREESARRMAAEAAARAMEERYGLAVRGADDAVWEWDLRTDRTWFSPRWKRLLGYGEQELSERVDEWRDRVHPDDRAGLLQALNSHLEGRASRFASEHRLQHRDGSWRWVYARATAVADAAGAPSRLIGLATDVSARKAVEHSLVAIAEGLSAVTGEACLRQLVRSFADVMGVREAFVCECIDFPTTHVRMLARWKAGDFASCVAFDLTGTACEDVICDGRPVFAPNDAAERWPLEKQYERHSYLGIPCLDSNGRVIGHIACADDKPMREELPHRAVLKIFGMRAAIELERTALDRERIAFLREAAARAGGTGPV